MTAQVNVWDLFVRIFHWSLVAFFVTSYITGEDESDLHIYSGYAIFTLISLRVVWGFVGSKHARFSDFVKSPAAVFAYISSMKAGKPKRYLGHNPAGGAMIVAMLITLFVITLSGMKLYAVEEGKGPFAANNQFQLLQTAYADDDEHEEKEHHGKHDGEESVWEEVHEAAVNFMLLLVLLHVAGVFVSGKLHNELLIKAMITGRKDADQA